MMGNIVPNSTPQILERTLDSVRLRANSNGECFGGEITDAMRDVGIALRVDRLEILLTRTVLVQTMEMLGEAYPAVLLQDYENPIPVSKALKYLTEAIEWTRRRKSSDENHLRSQPTQDGTGRLFVSPPQPHSTES